MPALRKGVFGKVIITRTPFRISFLGGGTDYPEWFNEHSGAVLTTTIDKYCFVGFRDGKVWSSFDLPPRSGMGTSSAYTVGLLKASAKQSNKTIAQLATIIERDKLAGNIGCQDQYICAVGGFRLLRFFPSGILDREVKDVSWLSDYLMLFDTCHYRWAGEIVSSQLKRIDQNKDVLQRLMELVPVGEDYLIKKDYKQFGLLLDEAWGLKKALSEKVSTTDIDDIYDKAIRSGAIGGKLLGAGGGGFMLFLVEPDKQESVKNALELYHVPFKFENAGSQIIYDSNQSKK